MSIIRIMQVGRYNRWYCIWIRLLEYKCWIQACTNQLKHWVNWTLQSNAAKGRTLHHLKCRRNEQQASHEHPKNLHCNHQALEQIVFWVSQNQESNTVSDIQHCLVVTMLHLLGQQAMNGINWRANELPQKNTLYREPTGKSLHENNILPVIIIKLG